MNTFPVLVYGLPMRARIIDDPVHGEGVELTGWAEWLVFGVLRLPWNGWMFQYPEGTSYWRAVWTWLTCDLPGDDDDDNDGDGPREAYA